MLNYDVLAISNRLRAFWPLGYQYEHLGVTRMTSFQAVHVSLTFSWSVITTSLQVSKQANDY